ncbi:hypothetical protein [Marmoricola sp. RAF53]|uniref:hypothetical protein n=1 Tax=Marmoricola sp. RAF53 TaxID=3233059 RepID=UPI003F945A93
MESEDWDRFWDRSRGGTHWVVAYERLCRALTADAADDLGRPHIVLCRDDETGTVVYSGPFPDGITALTYADAANAVEPPAAELSISFSVAALLPVTA